MNDKMQGKPSAEKTAEAKKQARQEIDLNALRIFVAVANLESFTAAAKQFEMPKWSVSRSISGLEDAMGVSLLHRTTRRVTLSQAGAALYESVAPLLESLDAASREWQEKLGEPAGNVRIAVSNFLQITPIGDAVNKFSTRYPAVHVDIHFTDLTNESAGEGYDLAVTIGSEKLKNPSLVTRRGWLVIGKLFASPKYIENHGMPTKVSDLDKHESIHFPDVKSVEMVGPNGKWMFSSSGHTHTNDVFFARETIRAGAGIGLLPVFLAERDVASNRLVNVLPECRSDDAYAYITRPYTREVPLRVKLLSDFLFEFMKANPVTTQIS